MEERFCPSHILICLGKALMSNTNLNDSSGNLGSVSEARLGLAQWPSLREHGKFAGSICHSQHELRKRTRKAWLNGLDPWLALWMSGGVLAALVVLWDYQKWYQVETLLSWCIQRTKENTRLFFVPKNVDVIWKVFSKFSSGTVCMSAIITAQWWWIKTADDNKWQRYHYVKKFPFRHQTSGIGEDPIHWKLVFPRHKQLIIQKLDFLKA